MRQKKKSIIIIIIIITIIITFIPICRDEKTDDPVPFRKTLDPELELIPLVSKS